MLIRSKVVCALAALLLLAAPQGSFGDEGNAAKELTLKGVKLTETKGVVTALDVPRNVTLAEDDFKKIGQLSHLQRLNFGMGLTNQQLSMLVHLPEVSAFITNGAELDDEGIKQLAGFKNLTSLTFFHPGRKMSGASLAELAALPKLESLSIGGSVVLGNGGVAAVGKLSHLKSLRLWHCRFDAKGVESLKELKDLHTLFLNYLPTNGAGDEAIATLASVKSLETITLIEEKLSLTALSQFKQLPALKSLTLTTIDIPESDVAKLKAELPHAQVKWTAPTPDELARLKKVNELKAQ